MPTSPSAKAAAIPAFKKVLSDPAVREVFLPGGPVGVFAPHGGGIEPGTEEIARAVAQATGATLYVLSAKRPTGNAALHVCSEDMLPGISAKLDSAVKACRMGIAIHGHGKTKGHPIYISGMAARAAKLAADAIRNAIGTNWEVVDDQAKIPRELAGMHKNNVVNRPREHGIQIELPRALREEARPAIRGDASLLVNALVEVVRHLA